MACYEYRCERYGKTCNSCKGIPVSCKIECKTCLHYKKTCKGNEDK